jgi:LysM repeat protein
MPLAVSPLKRTMSEDPEVLLPTGEPRYCTTCGARVAEKATSCLMCGSSFVPEDAEQEELLPDWAKGLVVVLLGVAILAGGAFGLHALLSTASGPSDGSAPTWTPTVTLTCTPSASPTTTPTPTRIPPLAHRVQEDENLTTIAALYGTTVEAILAMNPGIAPEYLQVGAVLKIPVEPPTPYPTSTYDPDVPTPTPPDFIVHVVESGETLVSIAEQYGVSVSLIRAANDLTPGEDTLFPNQSLVIPLGTPVPTATPTVDPQATPTPIPLYPAPPLLYPPNEAAFEGEGPIVLQWASVAVLADDEWYSLDILSSGDSAISETVRTRVTSWRVSEDLLREAGGGVITWSVRVVRRSPGFLGQPVYVEAGRCSPARVFVWLPAAATTETPSE